MSTQKYLTERNGSDNWNLRVNNINSNLNTNLTLDASGSSSMIFNTNGTQRLANNSSGVATFSTLPECSIAPTTSNQLVNKTYVDNKFSLKTIGTASAAIGVANGSWNNLYDMGILSAGTYFVCCQGRWEYALGTTTSAQVRVYNNTAGIDLLSYPQFVTLLAGTTYQPIGVSGIFTLSVASNVIVQSFCSYVPGAVQNWVQSSYWRIS